DARQGACAGRSAGEHPFRGPEARRGARRRCGTTGVGSHRTGGRDVAARDVPLAYERDDMKSDAPQDSSCTPAHDALVWWNGELVARSAARIPVDDSGFLAGHGVFETMLVLRGVPLFVAMHLERLTR